MNISLKGRSLTKLLDYERDEMDYLLQLTSRLKADKKKGKEKRMLDRKNIALLFEKTSTRTRCAFEVASYDQGAGVTYINASDSQFGKKESVKDTARVLGRMYDGIEFRGYSQETVEILAEYSGVPVWNGLTDVYHPTQIMADFFTMLEHNHKDLDEMSLVFLGDASNNVASSLIVGSAIMGIDFRIAAPKECQPDWDLLEKCQELGSYSGCKLNISEDLDVVSKADYLYTDVWLSMGEPESKWNDRIQMLQQYQINDKLLKLNDNQDVKIMHCLPAFHNRETVVGEKIFQKFGLKSMEITDEVFESESSIVFDQAENRMHSIKAIMVATLAGKYG